MFTMQINTTSYEEAMINVWPIIMYQIEKAGPKNDSPSISQTSISCLIVNDTAEGSQKVGKVPSSASRLKLCGWIVMGIAGLVAGMLI